MLRKQSLAFAIKTTPRAGMLSESVSRVPSLTTQQQPLLLQPSVKEFTGKEEAAGIRQSVLLSTRIEKSGTPSITSLKDLDTHHRTVPFLKISSHHSLWIMGNAKQVTVRLTDLWRKKGLSSRRLMRWPIKTLPSCLPWKSSLEQSNNCISKKLLVQNASVES